MSYCPFTEKQRKVTRVYYLLPKNANVFSSHGPSLHI